MDKKCSTYTSPVSKVASGKHKSTEPSKKAKGDCKDSESSSHTKIFRRKIFQKHYTEITTDEYLGISESISGSSDTFQCVHGPEGRQYTEKTKLKRNLIKELDPIPTDRKWSDGCPTCGWEVAAMAEFVVKGPLGRQNNERLEVHLRDFASIARFGYVGQIFREAGIAFSKLAEMMVLLNPMTDGGTRKWNDEEIAMLRISVHRFAADLNKLSHRIKRRTVSQIRTTLRQKAFKEFGETGCGLRKVSSTLTPLRCARKKPPPPLVPPPRSLRGVLGRNSEMTLNMLNASEYEIDMEDLTGDVKLEFEESDHEDSE